MARHFYSRRLHPPAHLLSVCSTPQHLSTHRLLPPYRASTVSLPVVLFCRRRRHVPTQGGRSPSSSCDRRAWALARRTLFCLRALPHRGCDRPVGSRASITPRYHAAHRAQHLPRLFGLTARGAPALPYPASTTWRTKNRRLRPPCRTMPTCARRTPEMAWMGMGITPAYVSAHTSLSLARSAASWNQRVISGR